MTGADKGEDQLALVDVHAHFLPRTLIGALRDRAGPPRIVETRDGTILEYGQGYVERIGEGAGSIDRLLEAMDRHGVAMSVVSINQPGVIGIPTADAVALARDANDELLDHVTSHRGRLAGLGTLPLQDADAAVAELERVMGAGLSGAMIVSNVNGASIAASEFQPVFEAAERLRAPLLLHPILPVAADRFRRYELTVALGFLFDTTTAATQLVLGGLYERHPRLTLVLGHAGSLLPQLAGRIDLEAKRNPAVRGRLSVLPSEHLRLIYTDTVCGWVPALRSALTLFGSTRVMFGSDFPFWDHGPSVEALSELARAGQLPAGVKADNAIRVFRLEPVHVTSHVAPEHVS